MLEHEFALPRSMFLPLCDALLRGHVRLTGGALLSVLQGEPIDLATQDFDLAVDDENDHYRMPNYGPPGDSARWLLGDDVALYTLTRMEPSVADDAGDYHELEKRDMIVTIWLVSYDAHDGVQRHFNVIDVMSKDCCIREDDGPIPKGLSWLPTTFDLSVCSNVLWANNLVLCDMNGVLLRQCVLDLSVYFRQYRVDVDLQRFRASIIQRIKKRVDKYRVRGYAIGIRPDLQERDGFIRCNPWIRDKAEAAQLLGREQRKDETNEQYYRSASEASEPIKRARLVAEGERICEALWDANEV